MFFFFFFFWIAFFLSLDVVKFPSIKLQKEERKYVAGKCSVFVSVCLDNSFFFITILVLSLFAISVQILTIFILILLHVNIVWVTIQVSKKNVSWTWKYFPLLKYFPKIIRLADFGFLWLFRLFSSIFQKMRLLLTWY